MPETVLSHGSVAAGNMLRSGYPENIEFVIHEVKRSTLEAWCEWLGRRAYVDAQVITLPLSL